jgi:cellulose synthase/poly-beta-1,6-N-acetylglucosamine synthase-like glycosyltransferase
MFASFVIPFHPARLDNLLQTIRLMHVLDTTVVESSELLLMCQDNCGTFPTPFKETRLFNLRLTDMHRAKSINKGVEAARSDKIVFMDSDRVLPRGYFEEAVNSLSPSEATAVTHIINARGPASDEEILQLIFPFTEEWRSKTLAPNSRNLCSGCTVIHKSDFLKAGGMDEDYIGYGYEDQDMTRRLERAGIKAVWYDGTEVHLYHERRTYGTSDQAALFIANGLRYCKKWGLLPTEMITQGIEEKTQDLI